MPLDIGRTRITLKCPHCRNSIDTPLTKHGGNSITRAVERLEAQAKRDGWNTDTPNWICPKHT